MAFDSLSEKLQNVFKNLRSKGRLTEDDVKTALKEVKMALLEADVNFRVVKKFVKDVQERAIGQDVMSGLNPGQMVIKIVNEEMVKLMGSETTEIAFRPGKELTVIMMVGLQGAGKTTTTAKIADKLKEYDAKNIVVDPVMVATSGARLISEEAIDALKSCLLPMATVLTPNIPEAEVLAGMKIQSQADMIRAAEEIGTKYHCAVLCKGGHQLNDANDLLWRDGGYKWFYGERIDNPNTHGTGCTLSSAIASNLAKEYDLDESVERAKKYISGALAAMLDLGKGSGPMNHGFAIKNEYTESKVEE